MTTLSSSPAAMQITDQERSPISRSLPGGQLVPTNSAGAGSASGLGQDQMARSPSAISTLSSSSISIPPHPGLLRRRSTDASGGLDYYFSSLAGAGGTSSSSSLASPLSGHFNSLSTSPSPSSSLSPMDSSTTAAAVALRTTRSHGNLGASAKASNTIEEQPYQDYDQNEKTPRLPDHSSSQPVQVYPTSALSIPSRNRDGSGGQKDEGIAKSPGGWSTSSSYSDPASAPASAGLNGPLANPAFVYHSSGRNESQVQVDNSSGSIHSESSTSAYSPLDYRAELHSFEGEVNRALLDPSTTSDWQRGREREIRDSVNSGSTYIPEFDETLHRTPVALVYSERPDIRPPHLNFHQSNQREASPTSGGSHSTPMRTVLPNTASTTSHYTPTTAGPVPRALGFGVTDFLSHMTPESAPKSAPASKSNFGELGMGEETEEDHEDTMKGKNRRTLPATTSASSGMAVDTLLSPDKYAREGTPSKEDVTRSPSPVRSPEPPPRSALRAQYLAQTEVDRSGASSPISMTPNSSNQPLPLPTIINTSYSPVQSPDKNKPQPQPPRPDRSPDRQHSPVFSSSATINDLTDMLGGAIDAIGLIDSRETPPPTVLEPKKREKPNMTLSIDRLAPAAEVTDRGPMTPTSLPMRGTSLPGTGPTPSPALIPAPGLPPGQASTHARRQTQPEISRKTSSILSNGSSNQITIQSPTISISARPWPAAMLYGNVKTLKHAGDRAKGYAKAINELARSESGLREWCAASSSQVNRPVRGMPAPSKMAAAASLGVRSNSVPSAIPLSYNHNYNQGQSSSHAQSQVQGLALSPYDSLPQPQPHMRNVSSSSEFPMRADSYTAREISQRIMDPSDQPTALPPNLPYPQLQQSLGASLQMGGGNLKPSQSMQSVASFSSTKKGFFSAIGRKGSSKKESISIGPPLNGNMNNNNGGLPKKDVRGLSISAPRSTSPNKVVVGVAGEKGLHAPRVQASISAPMGPRGPRMGSFTPPPSVSSALDRNKSEGDSLPVGRASLDTGLSRMTPPRLNDQSYPYQRGRGSIDYHEQSPLQTHSQEGENNTSTAMSPRDKQVEDAVRSIADVLPHVERNVLRGYYIRHGDQMQAIGAYLEDEKNGSVVR